MPPNPTEALRAAPQPIQHISEYVQYPADLAALVAAWPNLPETVRAQLVAIASAAKRWSGNTINNSPHPLCQPPNGVN
jgi:hypothetical protein